MRNLITGLGLWLAGQGLAGAAPVDFEAVRYWTAPDHTRVVFINTPGNPAGNMIPADQLRTLADLCSKRDIWLVSDEVYSMITFEDRHVSLRTAAERLENVVVIDGLSKSHAMTGWRLGWVVTHQRLVEHLLNFFSSTVFGCSQFVQDAAAFALQNDEE